MFRLLPKVNKTNRLSNTSLKKQALKQILLMLICLVLAGFSFLGCASKRLPPNLAQIPGYLELRENPRSIDFSPLQGRRIVLDPGHGGYFPGAVGPDGLTEASVNLGVALYLRGMLEWAGAEVYMTRTADYDFLTQADSTLASDLAWRVDFTEQLQPDVFLSIHHNSTASRDPEINETQTYYPLNDKGASLDLAQAIHRHLVLNLEISPAKILPGNFHVLRNLSVPAVLGEPAMLSNPVIEKRLTLAASQQLEASAYFIGLLDYFSAGTPVWAGAAVDTIQIFDASNPPTVSWTFCPSGLEQEANTSPGPDPATYTLYANNILQPIQLSPDGYTAIWNISNQFQGQSVWLEISGRNLRGRATGKRRTLLLPPETAGLTVELISEAGTPGQSTASLLRWSPDSYLAGKQGTLLINGTDQVEIVGAQSGCKLVYGAPELSFSPEADLLQVAGQTVESVAIHTLCDTLPENWSWHMLVQANSQGVESNYLPLSTWNFRSIEANKTPTRLFDLQDGPAVAIISESPLWLEAPGILPLIDPVRKDETTSGTVNRIDRNWHVQILTPSVVGKTIVLDPIGGGTVTNLVAPLGLRGADLNLATAIWAARLLTGAGANVYLTRTDESLLPDEEKVRLAGKVGANLFLTIGRTSGYSQISARHHPGSVTGSAWANSFLQAYSPMVGDQCVKSLVEAYDYVLRHTACPALSVRLPFPTDPESELVMATPGFAMAEARSILLSVAAVTGNPDILTNTLQVKKILEELPAEALPVNQIDRVLVDGNFPWVPLPAAKPALQPGPVFVDSVTDPGLPGNLFEDRTQHTIEIHSGRLWQVWLMESGTNGNTYRLLLQGQ